MNWELLIRMAGLVLLLIALANFIMRCLQVLPKLALTAPASF
jgi:hypothetical protein